MTKKIWETDDSGVYVFECDTETGHDTIVLEISDAFNEGKTLKEQKEVGRRIVALWNLAEERGWTTEDLETGLIPSNNDETV